MFKLYQKEIFRLQKELTVKSQELSQVHLDLNDTKNYSSDLHQALTTTQVNFQKTIKF